MAPKLVRSHFAMSVLGTGPKWRSGQRSGAVRVWPGGMRAGSTPSGRRLLLKKEATRRASIGAPLYSAFTARCDDCGPVAQLGARVNRTHEVRGSNPLRSTKIVGANSPPVCGPRAAHSRQRAHRLPRHVLGPALA